MPHKETQIHELAVEITLTEGRWFDGLAVGEFTDMWGRELEIKQSDLQKYMNNTIENISTTADADGQIVGLPIDSRDHERGEAAGWIVDVRLAESGDKLQFKPKWTDVGLELIRSGRMRYFSATFNFKEKVIVGGTLTNWPATRDEKEKILLAPVGLSKPDSILVGIRQAVKDVLADFFGSKDTNQPEQGAQTMSKNKDEQEEVNVLELAKKELDITGDYADLSEVVAELANEQARQMVQHELAEQAKRRDIAAFVQGVTGGTEDHPTGLPVKADRLEEFMTMLTDEQREMAQEIFEAIHESGQVDFQEKGHGADVKGKKELPQRVQKALDDGDLKIADLSKPSMGLGDISQYNLSKWDKE